MGDMVRDETLIGRFGEDAQEVLNRTLLEVCDD
jgi:hypothetical protein